MLFSIDLMHVGGVVQMQLDNIPGLRRLGVENIVRIGGVAIAWGHGDGAGVEQRIGFCLDEVTH